MRNTSWPLTRMVIVSMVFVNRMPRARNRARSSKSHSEGSRNRIMTRVLGSCGEEAVNVVRWFPRHLNTWWPQEQHRQHFVLAPPPHMRFHSPGALRLT